MTQLYEISKENTKATSAQLWLYYLRVISSGMRMKLGSQKKVKLA